MELLNVTVLGQPIPKARPRFSKGHAYTPKRTKDYEKLIQANLPNIKIHEPIEVQITAIFKRPQRLKTKHSPSGLIPHTKRPDLDNVVKAILDALNNILVDDSQVYSIQAKKFYAEINQEPQVNISIRKSNEH